MTRQQTIVRLAIPTLLLLIFIALRLKSAELEVLARFADNAQFVTVFEKVIEALIWLSAAWLLGRLVAVVITLTRGGTTVSGEGTKLLADVAMLIFVSAGLLIILAFVFDQPLTGLIATSGFLAAIIGFALRNMIADLFSGIALNVEKPFTIGDWIETDSGEQGEIIEMNWRATRLRTIQGRMVVVPNSKLAEHKFTNLYRPERPFRVVKTLVVDYQAPPQRVVDIFLSAMESTDGVLRDCPNIVLIEGSTERGVEYGLHFWVDHAVRRYIIERHVMINAIEFLNQAGLTPAYPKIDITVARPQLREINRGVEMEVLLRRTDFFQALPSDVLKKLADSIELRAFAAGSEIVQQGGEGGSLYVVITGLADVYINDPANDHERCVASLRPGQVFGEVSLLTGAPRGATIKAVTQVSAAEVRKSDLEPALRAHPELIDTLSAMQSERLAGNTAQLALSEQDKNEISESGMRQFLHRKMQQFFNLSRAETEVR